MNITPHFTKEELTRTGTGLENEPTPEAKANLKALASGLLEPIRALLRASLSVHSGYRCLAVNHAVGGATNSAHMEGRACDFQPQSTDPIRYAFDHIRKSGLPYDKLILEYKGSGYWIHVQSAKAGQEPRRKAYIAQVTDHGTVYKEIV